MAAVWGDTEPGTTWWEHTQHHLTAHSFKRFERQRLVLRVLFSVPKRKTFSQPGLDLIGFTIGYGVSTPPKNCILAHTNR